MMRITDSEHTAVGSPSHVPSVPWGVRDIILGILLAAGGVLALNVILLLISTVTGSDLSKNGNVLSIFLAVQDVTIVGAAGLMGVVRHRVGWDRMGLRPFLVPLGCSLSLGLLMVSYVVRLFYGLVASALGFQVTQQQIVTQLNTQGPGFLLTLFAAAVVAPIAEEIFFRGFLYGGLRGRIGVAGAMIVSTLFFTALHFTEDLFIPIFVLGLFLAWLYEYTGSLYPGILLHAANNGIALVLYFILQATGLLPK